MTKPLTISLPPKITALCIGAEPKPSRDRHILHRKGTKDCLARLAPPAPPCFNSQAEWLEWLDSVSSTEISTTESRPLMSRLGKLKFNINVNFCADCRPCYKQKMESAGRCQPSALLGANGVAG